MSTALSLIVLVFMFEINRHQCIDGVLSSDTWLKAKRMNMQLIFERIYIDLIFWFNFNN